MCCCCCCCCCCCLRGLRPPTETIFVRLAVGGVVDSRGLSFPSFSQHGAQTWAIPRVVLAGSFQPNSTAPSVVSVTALDTAVSHGFTSGDSIVRGGWMGARRLVHCPGCLPVAGCLCFAPGSRQDSVGVCGALWLCEVFSPPPPHPHAPAPS